jgi:CRP-like cAMP-binding protein
MPTIEDDIAFLDSILIFHQLGAAALRILAISAEGQELAAGRALFTAGEAADCAYVIRRGSVSLNTGRAHESEIIAGPGTLLGESALLIESRRPATALAREDSAVLRISRSMFLRMLDGYPDAAQRLRGLFAARAEQWADEMENVRAVLADGGEGVHGDSEGNDTDEGDALDNGAEDHDDNDGGGGGKAAE